MGLYFFNPLPGEIWGLTSAWSGLKGAGKPRLLKILAYYRAGPFGKQDIGSVDDCSLLFPLNHATNAWNKSHGEEKHGVWSQREPAVSLVLPLSSCVIMLITYILWTSIFLSIAWSTVMSSFRSSKTTILNCLGCAGTRPCHGSLSQVSLAKDPLGLWIQYSLFTQGSLHLPSTPAVSWDLNLSLGFSSVTVCPPGICQASPWWGWTWFL